MIAFVVGIEGSPHEECAKCLKEAYRYINGDPYAPIYIDIDAMYRDPSMKDRSIAGALCRIETTHCDLARSAKPFDRFNKSLHLAIASIQFENWKMLIEDPQFITMRQPHISCTIFNLLRDDEDDYRMSDDYQEFKQYAMDEKHQVDFIIGKNGLCIDDSLHSSYGSAALDILLRIQIADWTIQQFLPDHDLDVKKFHHQYAKLYELATSRISERSVSLEKNVQDILAAHNCCWQEV